ncbi:PAS domain-containing sensor histidine kinase [Methylophaga thiooxydans]|uniref:PAS domain-containing sensor histidine kinase n=1 Tax=Methylophaga thiooxydans TaxID=392484 RepID=UPI002353C44B|nr:PAS domain-containing protein [Methylophaga thiooxydans]
MSSRIALFLDDDGELLNYLNLHLSAGVMLEYVSAADTLYSRLEDKIGVPDILVLGLNVQEPIRIAEHTLVLHKGIKVIIFCDDNQKETIRKSILFSPFLSSDVTTYIYDNKDNFLDLLQQKVDAIENQRNYANTIAEAERERLASMTGQPLVTNYLDRLLDRVPIGILNLDSKGKILNLNPCAQRLLKYSERDLVSTYFYAVFPDTHESQIKDMIAAALSTQDRGNSGNQTVSFYGPKGKCYFDMTISSLAKSASEPILTVILQEVTLKVQEENKRRKIEQALHQSEQQLLLVINAIPELIAYVDKELRYQFNNKAFEKWFGLSRQAICGRVIWDVIGEPSYRIVEKYVSQAMAGNTVTFEERLSYPNSGVVYIRSTYVPNFSETGEVQGFVVLTSDITQSKSDEELEKKHLLELAHTSRMITIGEMSSQLAHELSQPLTSIEAYSRACITLIQKDKTTKEEILSALENVSSQAIRAQEIMHELRNFVKKDDSRKTVCVNTLINSAIKLLRLEFQEQDPEVELKLSEDLPHVFADRILIEQILINLIKNAIEAMRVLVADERQLIIESHNQSEEVLVSVHDSGPGLSEYEINKIFEPFYTTKPEGMGMGLAITRSIIYSHGGRLLVEKNTYGGTTFKFTLPVEDIEFIEA